MKKYKIITVCKDLSKIARPLIVTGIQSQGIQLKASKPKTNPPSITTFHGLQFEEPSREDYCDPTLYLVAASTLSIGWWVAAYNLFGSCKHLRSIV